MGKRPDLFIPFAYKAVNEFPSPCGEWVGKAVDLPDQQVIQPGKFPSPCGEWVGKEDSSWLSEMRKVKVSVPLRGMGWESAIQREITRLTDSYSFRPLAGNGLGKARTFY